MNIYFRELDKTKIDDFICVSNWDNDSEIKYFVRPNFSEDEISDIIPEELFENALTNNNNYVYIIIADDNPIGYVSIQKDPPHLYHKVNNTAWVSIAIGDKKYRGAGIGKIAMQFLEEKCRDRGLNRIELGVFAFNINAIKLYKKSGYKEIAIVKKFTFYNGKWQDDIRMEKYLK